LAFGFSLANLWRHASVRRSKLIYSLFIIAGFVLFQKLEPVDWYSSISAFNFDDPKIWVTVD